MYTLNGWWFLSSGGAYPPVFMVAYELIENDYLEKEEAALHHRSTRIQEGIGHGLLSLPPFKKFVGTKIITSMSKYPPPPPPQMQLLQKRGTHVLQVHPRSVSLQPLPCRAYS